MNLKGDDGGEGQGCFADCKYRKGHGAERKEG